MANTEGRVLARAALAGNPSDGFGGAVLAAVVPGLEAVVRASDADGVVVGDRSWPTVSSVAGPHLGEGALLSATVERLASWMTAAGRRPPGDGVELVWSTSIPPSVGLAGSSALVIAALRALADRWVLDLAPLTLARLALEVEVDVLGFAAGPQDRLVQTAGRTVLMDFAGDEWSVRPVDPPSPVELFVAWSTAAPAPSHQVHGPLQQRRDEPAVVAAMARLATLAAEGAAALAAGDGGGLAAALDGSYRQRAAVVDLEPAHVALISGARGAGAAVNYAGSGGAVVGLAGPDVGLDEVARWAVAEGHGFHRFTAPAAHDSR